MFIICCGLRPFGHKERDSVKLAQIECGTLGTQRASWGVLLTGQLWGWAQLCQTAGGDAATVAFISSLLCGPASLLMEGPPSAKSLLSIELAPALAPAEQHLSLKAYDHYMSP